MKNTNYNHNSIADVIAFAIKATRSRQLQTRSRTSTICEIVVVNQEYRYSILFVFRSYIVYLLNTLQTFFFPGLLTMWDQFAYNEGAFIQDMISTKPVIIGTHLKVVSFDGNDYTITTSVICSYYER